MTIFVLRQSVFLIGFSGSGKTTVGMMLAHRLGIPFVDTDRQIERRSRSTIPDIFEKHGEVRFRRIESDVIRKVALSRLKRVVALGGGAYQSQRNRQLIGKAGVTIYLSCSAPELYRRLRVHTDRPLLGKSVKINSDSRQARVRRIKMLLTTRIRAYHTADIRVSTTGKTVREVVTLIERKLREFDAAHCGQSR